MTVSYSRSHIFAYSTQISIMSISHDANQLFLNDQKVQCFVIYVFSKMIICIYYVLYDFFYDVLLNLE